MLASDVVTTIVTVLGSAFGGGLGAWMALRDRVQAIEHELWGVKGTNGLKGYATELSTRIDAIIREERSSRLMTERRNHRQHPDDDDSI